MPTIVKEFFDSDDVKRMKNISTVLAYAYFITQGEPIGVIKINRDIIAIHLRCSPYDIDFELENLQTYGLVHVHNNILWLRNFRKYNRYRWLSKANRRLCDKFLENNENTSISESFQKFLNIFNNFPVKEKEKEKEKESPPTPKVDRREPWQIEKDNKRAKQDERDDFIARRDKSQTAKRIANTNAVLVKSLFDNLCADLDKSGIPADILPHLDTTGSGMTAIQPWLIENIGLRARYDAYKPIGTRKK